MGPRAISASRGRAAHGPSRRWRRSCWSASSITSGRGGGALWSAEDFNASAATHYAERGLSGAPAIVTDEDLNKVRDKRRELFARWAALPAGEALELPFP